VNNYYLPRFTEEDPAFPAAQKFLTGGDIGALVNVAGMGVLDVSDQPEAAQELIDFMLSGESQTYFVEDSSEYPLVDGIDPPEGMPSLDEIDTPDINLSDLDDLEGTLDLLREAGVL
jgi:iron(III) transport system substrate-binding protein